MNSLMTQRRILLICFLFIPVVLILLFVAFPAIKLLQLSFTNWNGISSSFKYIGLDNYKTLIFNSPDTWNTLKNNWIYFSLHALMIPVELVIAVILNGKLRASKFFKSIVFLPYIINGVAVAYMFSFFYSSEGGALNMILDGLQLGALKMSWLGNENIVNYSLVVISLWRYCGSHIILFIAGLQSLPNEYYEAATVDGANAVQQFLFITIPGLMRVIEIVLFLNVRGALQAFDIPFVVTHGGPGNASSTFALFTINTAFQFNDFGMATTMGVVLILMIIVFNRVQNEIVKRVGG